MAYGLRLASKENIIWCAPVWKERIRLIFAPKMNINLNDLNYIPKYL